MIQKAFPEKSYSENKKVQIRVNELWRNSSSGWFSKQIQLLHNWFCSEATPQRTVGTNKNPQQRHSELSHLVTSRTTSNKSLNSFFLTRSPKAALNRRLYWYTFYVYAHVCWHTLYISVCGSSTEMCGKNVLKIQIKICMYQLPWIHLSLPALDSATLFFKVHSSSHSYLFCFFMFLVFASSGTTHRDVKPHY